MTGRYERALTTEELLAVPDENVDLGEVPELDDAFWERARVHHPDGAVESLTLRLDDDVLAWFRSLGPGYETRMSAVLRAYYEANVEPSTRADREAS